MFFALIAMASHWSERVRVLEPFTGPSGAAVAVPRARCLHEHVDCAAKGLRSEAEEGLGFEV